MALTPDPLTPDERQEVDLLIQTMRLQAEIMDLENAIGFTTVTHYEGRTDTVSVTGFWERLEDAAQWAVESERDLNRKHEVPSDLPIDDSAPFIVEVKPVGPSE